MCSDKSDSPGARAIAAAWRGDSQGMMHGLIAQLDYAWNEIERLRVDSVCFEELERLRNAHSRACREVGEWRARAEEAERTLRAAEPK